MAALNRLSQRIKENFAETTRDLKLLSGTGATAGSSSSTYFDAASTSDDKAREIATLLEAKHETEKLEGMKRIIAGVSKGRDMERFFAQVVKNVVTPSIEVRKLSYIFLLRYAASNSELLLLSINTFQKDLSDPSPLIRSMSLRVLTSIRVPIIQGIVMLGLKKLANDRNPWVRKTVATGLPKVHSMDPSSLSQLIPILQTLLGSQSPLTLGATLTAFDEICPDRLDLLHPFFRHICRLLMDADEWGQAVAINVLTRYARTMLEKPDEAIKAGAQAGNDGEAGEHVAKTAKEESEDEFEGLDEDLAMLLHYSKPLFHSRNPAVILATAKMWYALAPAQNKAVGQDQIVAPLLRLAGSAGAHRQEIAAVTWDVIATMAEERPGLFAKQHTRFFVHADEPDLVKIAKIRALSSLLSETNATASMREFKHYIRFPSDLVAEAAIKAIGQCVRTQLTVAAAGLSSLMRLLQSQRDSLVASAVLVLKTVILSPAQSADLPPPQKLVARLAKALDGITNPSARASVFWLVGQFAASDAKLEHGLGWEGVAAWVPDVLRKGIKGFAEESSQAKLQILTLAAKLLVVADVTPLLVQMTQYLFNIARYDADYDVRDRSRFFSGLLRGIKPAKPLAAMGGTEEAKSNGETVEEEQDEQEEMSGVVLRREQIRVVLLGNRQVDDDTALSRDFEIATLSRQLRRRLAGYEPLPDWTDDPTDPSLREVERPKPEAPTSVSSSTAAHSRTGPPGPMSMPVGGSRPAVQSGNSPLPPRSAALAGGSPFGSSPAGSVPRESKAKFKDLDAFLNSETEDEEEDDDTEDDDSDGPRAPAASRRQPMAVSAPPRREIVPEYYDTSDEDDEEEEETDEDDDEGGEDARKPLTGRR